MILKILQITGIVLLSLLGLILLLVFLALVLPVKYKLSCNAEEGSKPAANLNISYFLYLIRARADYTDALYVKVKILFFTVFQLKIPDKDEENVPDYDLSELDEELEALDDENETVNTVFESEENVPQDNTESMEEPANSEDAESGEDAEKIDSESDSGDTPGDEPEEEKSEDSEDSAFSKLRLKFEEIYDKIKRVRSEIRYYRNLYNSNEAKNAIFVIKKRVKRILKKVLPRRAHADVVFGFDSPDITGKVYGLYTLFARRFDKSSKVMPDFERKIFEGSLYCKGHFNIWCLIWNGLCVILNKNVRKIYRSYKHHSKKKENEEGSLDKAA